MDKIFVVWIEKKKRKSIDTMPLTDTVLNILMPFTNSTAVVMATGSSTKLALDAGQSYVH